MNKSSRHIEIIDCTFRDGGYYNNWFFSKDLVNKYLLSISKCGIKYVEIGYRRINYSSFLGPLAYSSESYLRSLSIPKNIKLGVMINLDDFKNDLNPSKIILENFLKAKDSLLSFVRIAVKIDDIAQALEISSTLKKLGYFVFINLMQIKELNSKDFLKINKNLTIKNKPNVFYFADSFGNLEPNDIKYYVTAISSKLKSPVGFHAHNNMGNALSNSLLAIENKANWIDATMLGMGRGAGNTPTEYLILNLQKTPKLGYKPDPIYPLLLEEFESMKQKYHWGDNILYYLSAINNIHPSYVQELLNQDHYTTYQILDAINFLKDAKYTNFTRENLNQAIFSYRKNAEGTFNPEKLIKNKSVLILANGASLQEYKNDILNFIESKSPFVLSLNINKTIDERFIDAYIACYPSKIILDINQLKKLKRPLIIPKFSLPIEVNNQLKNRVLNYGLSIKKNIFKVQKKNCTLPTPLVMGYALAFCKSGLANQIYLAGFDGYESNDPRNIEADVFLKFFTSLKLKLKVITPSRYDLPKQSLYSLSID